MRKSLAFALLAALVAALVPSFAGAQVPPTPPRDQWFAENDTGHWSNGDRVRIDESCLKLPKPKQLPCSLKAFERKPFVVIAFVDSGVNPYHQDFRAPEFVHHPSKYIEGYPAEAQALRPSFALADAKGYDAARAKDDAMWKTAKRDQLYWFPGTRIIGGISRAAGDTSGEWQERAILDDQGHGTGVVSVGAGQHFGSNPNALIVMVEGLGERSLDWATSQPWIDIVSNSWGNTANLPLGDPESTRVATQRGQTVVFSAGNGATNTNSSTVFPPGGPVEDPCKCKTPDSDNSMTDPWSGPSWLLTIGAASPINGQAHWWHSIPVDVASFGSKWRAAGAWGVKPVVDEENVETRDFGGTSCAAPTTAGVLSSIIERARIELGDTTGGQRPDQVVAVGKKKLASGPLDDGKLTRLEAEALVQKTASPVPADPEKITWDYAVRPTTPIYYLHQGYGVVTRDSKALALDVLLGKEELPDRTEVDTFVSAMDEIRNAIWGEP
ncbi:MAG TPA: S8 family serine peptidase [Actinomycetota bacterium]|nr:S8 family serine peptidase [Actinomycetota bacterium]